MTTSALVLILSVLILGGVIATLGDRIGTKVGKARLSLFNLRPRKTAVVITILTGFTISAVNLAILFATSKPLRTGVFQVDEIQDRLRRARGELDETIAQKQKTEQELAQTVAQKEKTEQELSRTLAQRRRTERELDKTLAQQQQTKRALEKTLSEQAATQRQLNAAQTQQAAAQEKLDQILAQLTTRREQIERLQAEREQLISQRDRVRRDINQLQDQNKELNQENQALDTENNQLRAENQQRENRLKELEKQQEFLQREVAVLEQYYQSYQALRTQNLALLRGQLLAYGVFRIVDPNVTQQVVDQLLSQANRNAIEATRSGNPKPTNERVVQVSEAQVNQLLNQIKDGQEYIVRIFSAGNYVIGEKQVQVIADADVNQVVFRSEQVLAAITADPSTMTNEQLQERINLLLGAVRFRANREGLLFDEVIVGDNRINTLVGFLERLRGYQQSVDIKAVVVEDIYTSGPLKVQLIATQNGQVLFTT